MTPLAKQKYERDDGQVSKAIDEVLRKIFGKEATLLIYEYLENRYSLKRNEIVEKIDVFAEGLEDFLRSGAHIIEVKILEDIYSSCGSNRGLKLERRSRYDFVSQMKMLTQRA